MATMPRRAFVAACSAALVIPPPRSRAATLARRMDGGLPAGFPAQDPGLVERTVAAAHTDLDAVRALVTARPALAAAAWDWGFGDWESALGAASHMGRRDIAELLIAHGARPNLFTFAMLGQVDVVRAICEANAGVQSLHGPHGITLLAHARRGGAAAAAVVEYLVALGGADERPADLPLPAGAVEACAGSYRIAGTGVVLRVARHSRREALTVRRGDRPSRMLRHEGDLRFSPGGAPAVRIEFDVRDDVAATMTILDGDLHVAAARVAAAGQETPR
jgi:hypothetical protein